MVFRKDYLPPRVSVILADSLSASGTTLLTGRADENRSASRADSRSGICRGGNRAEAPSDSSSARSLNILIVDKIVSIMIS